MDIALSALEMDWLDVSRKISTFVKDYVTKTGAKGIVVGLSGGVDSSTVAALSALAIGGNNVTGIILPERETRNTKDVADAELLASKFGITTETCDITPTLNAIYRSIPIFDSTERVCKGNIKARTRMIYVYYYANKRNLIVCGSSDKSETMMGYFTKWGDVAADISPVMDLYKTQVRRLAVHIGLPHRIASKPSTPSLWPGQTAEAELGLPYEQLDLVLYGLERFRSSEELSQKLSIDEPTIRRIKQRWLEAEHKRSTLLTAKLGYRTVGWDFRIKRG